MSTHRLAISVDAEAAVAAVCSRRTLRLAHLYRCSPQTHATARDSPAGAVAVAEEEVVSSLTWFSFPALMLLADHSTNQPPRLAWFFVHASLSLPL
jgi:hypothetical protein